MIRGVLIGLLVGVIVTCATLGYARILRHSLLFQRARWDYFYTCPSHFGQFCPAKLVLHLTLLAIGFLAGGMLMSR